MEFLCKPTKLLHACNHLHDITKECLENDNPTSTLTYHPSLQQDLCPASAVSRVNALFLSPLGPGNTPETTEEGKTDPRQRICSSTMHLIHQLKLAWNTARKALTRHSHVSETSALRNP
jgi:hypothetical protein